MKKAAIILIVVLLLAAGFLEWGIDRRSMASGNENNGNFSNAAKILNFLGGARQYLAYSLFVKTDKLDHEYYGSTEREKDLVPYFILISMLDPNYVSAYYIGASLMYDLGQKDEAIDFNLKGIASNPNSGDLAFSLGILYLQETRYYEAIDAFERAQKLESTIAPAITITQGLVACYKATGQDDKALESRINMGVGLNVSINEADSEESWKQGIYTVNMWWSSVLDATGNPSGK